MRVSGMKTALLKRGGAFQISPDLRPLEPIVAQRSNRSTTWRMPHEHWKCALVMAVERPPALQSPFR